MPLSSPWYDWRPERTAPEVVGVYELAHVVFGTPRIVYIGQGSIQARIRAHDRDDVKRFSKYRCVTTRCRRRSKQIERQELHRFSEWHDRLPVYNQRIG